MKLLTAACSIVSLCYVATAEPYDAADDVSTLLDQGRYREAFTLTERILNAPIYSTQIKASVLHIVARFHENDAGDSDRALAAYRRLLSLDLEPESSLVRDARDSVRRLEGQKQAYMAVSRELDRIAHSAATKERAASAIATLRSLARDNPHYPEFETIQYYLGLYLFLEGAYGESYRLLTHAMERSGIAAKFPNVTRLREQAQEKWLWTYARNTAWSVIGIVLLVCAALFFLSRPWRWVRLQHWLLALVLVLSWWGLFSVASKRLGAQAQEAIAETTEDSTSIISMFGNPAEYAFKALFRFGLVGTLGIALLVLATARFRLRWTVAVVNLVVSFALFSSLMIVFYDRYGTRGKISLPIEEPSVFDHMKAAIVYSTDEIKPFILTNPTAFSNLNISNIYDPELRDWLMGYLRTTPAETGTHENR